MGIALNRINRITIGSRNFSLYHTWDGVSYLVLELDGVYLRWGIRDGYDVEDWTLTATGFDGIENTDWENVSSIDLSTMSDIDGNIYRIINIGNQKWLLENIKGASYGGTYPDNDIANVAVYGRLYTWAEANAINITGYGLPTLAEITALSTYLGGDAVSGGHLKEDGTTHWTNDNADNSSGFTALSASIDESSLGGNAAFWGDSFNVPNANFFSLSDMTTATIISNIVKTHRFSVRLIKK